MSHPDFSPLPEPAPPPDAKGRSAPPPRTAPTRGAFVATPALAYALPLFLACEGAGAGVVYGASYQPGLASYQTKEAFTAFQYGSCKGTLSWAEKAIQTWTPYLDDQMYFLARAVGVMAESGRLDRCPEWPRLLEISRGIAQRLFRNHPTHVRQRGIYANFLFAMGRATHDQKLLDEARVNYEQLVTESPNRQQYRFDYSNFLAENGRVPEGEAQLQRAVQADPQVGEARWRLGIYQWGRMNQAQLGAEQMIKGATEGCPYPVHSLEVSQLTSAYMVRGDREGMKSLLKFLDGLAPDDRPTQVHLSVAASFERIGMIPERDKVLALAVSRDTSLAPRLQPLRDGRVRSLAELDQYYQQQKAAQQAKPPAAPPPTPWTPGAGAPKK
jgi:tetratricopeptide (TPR) repeat protein